MRVTAEVQAETRRKILAVAQELFASPGFTATTTRDIAKAAKIAAGTLFNYFTSKEAILASLASTALAEAQQKFDGNWLKGASLEEDLFALVAAGLRRLKPFRRDLPAVLGIAVGQPSPEARDESPRLRILHLEAVGRLAREHGFEELTLVAQQMYWSLYAGLLLFWAEDNSPRQEDTLALLDHSLEMFVSWLKSQAPAPALSPLTYQD
jgi:AcrR family transcriptional regulator